MLKIRTLNYTIWSTLIQEGASPSTTEDSVVSIDADKFNALESFGVLGDSSQYEKLGLH